MNERMQINTYLTFNGNCREAMSFYQQCLGGELQFQTIGESPLAEKMPGKMRKCILHATLTNGTLVLMGSDMVGNDGLQKGNAVSLSLHCSSEEQIKLCYKKLAAGGIQNHPVETTFFGALLGDLTDRYGNHWLLHFGMNKRQDGD
ncbi:MAG: VOC family protein [Bacteroidetes bacterium]|nr:VOC family protein [Bacteroidota bacterium]